MKQYVEINYDDFSQGSYCQYINQDRILVIMQGELGKVYGIRYTEYLRLMLYRPEPVAADCTIMPLHFGVVEHSCRAE